MLVKEVGKIDRQKSSEEKKSKEDYYKTSSPAEDRPLSADKEGL